MRPTCEVKEICAMATHDWGAFYSLTRDSSAWPLLVRATSLAVKNGRALDLGAGAGRDTRYLLRQGFDVTAVDADPRAVALLSTLPRAHLRVVQSTFDNFDFDFASYDLISSQFALPFMSRDRFDEVLSQLKAALAPGGIFAGQFFGIHDQWNTPDSNMTFLTRAEAEAYLSDLETIEFSEEDADGHVADGSPKHWHVFHILARRPAPPPASDAVS
jgi:tellurite methyltransferase